MDNLKNTLHFSAAERLVLFESALADPYSKNPKNAQRYLVDYDTQITVARTSRGFKLTVDPPGIRTEVYSFNSIGAIIRTEAYEYCLMSIRGLDIPETVECKCPEKQRADYYLSKLITQMAPFC